MGIIDRNALRGFANRFESEVGTKLYSASRTLQKARAVEYANFTTLHGPLAAVYVEAWNLQNIDLEQKAQAAQEIRTRLRASADAWDRAEHANTVPPDGAN